jgi:signal transduction histidine kinase
MDIEGGGDGGFTRPISVTGMERARRELERLRNQAPLGVLCFGWLGFSRYEAGYPLLPVLGLAVFFYLALGLARLDIGRRPESDPRLYITILLDCATLAFGIWLDKGPDSPIFLLYFLLQGAITVRFPGRFSLFAMAASLATYSAALALYDFSAPGAGGPVHWPMEAGKLLAIIILPVLLRPLVARHLRLRERISEVADRLSFFKAGEEILRFDREGEDVVLILKEQLERLSAGIKENQEIITGRAALLEGQVEESLRMLRDEMERAQSSDKMKTGFLNMIHHELRTPLHHIMGFAEILEKQSNPSDNSAKMAGIIKNRAAELFENLEKLTKLSTLMSNDRPLDTHPVNIADMARELAESLAETGKKKNLRIASRVRGDIQNVLIDYEVIRDILRELLSNAVKFSPAGGEVAMDISYDGASLTMAVSDQGEGFNNGQGQALLIGLFRQKEGGLGRKFEGFGVGLYFVQQLVTLHGGELYAGGRDGGGSIFTVTVPAEPLALRK